MARRTGLVGPLLCLLVVAGNAHASSESLTFRRATDGRFLAALDGYSDGPGCTPEYRAPASVEIVGDTIVIGSPADNDGCFIPMSPRPYEVLADLGTLTAARYEVRWTQPGLPDRVGLLVRDAIGNRVPNPDFEDGLDGWSAADGGGDFALDGEIGMLDAPSLRVTGGAVQSSCIAVDPSVTFDLRALARSDAGTASLTIQPYSDAQCATRLDPLGGSRLEANPYWWPMSLEGETLPDQARAVRIVLGAAPDALGATPDVHFDRVRFGETGSVPVGIPFSQEGLTGTWYDPSTSGQGFELVISNDDTFGALRMFGSWYTYDVANRPSAQHWYSLQSIAPTPTGPVAFAIYRNTGGNFAAPPDTTAQIVGGGTLTFLSCTSGLITYAFADGIAENSIPIRRLLPNVGCDEDGLVDAPASDFGLSGAWYDANVSGQGFVIEVNPDDAQIFFGWYTYAPSDRTQRWFSAQGAYTVGSASVALTLYASMGGTFGEPGGVVTLPVGVATLHFASCTEASLDYAFTTGEMTGRTGTIALTRLGAPLASCARVN